MSGGASSGAQNWAAAAILPDIVDMALLTTVNDTITLTLIETQCRGKLSEVT